MSDNYVKVQCKKVFHTRDAMRVDAELRKGKPSREGWVPFSLMRGGQEDKLKLVWDGKMVEFFVFEWKATELGLQVIK